MDGLRNHEIVAALVENERAVRAAATGVHRAFSILEENTRTVLENGKRITDVERQLGQLRSSIETLVHLEQRRLELERDRLNLERDKMELETSGEVMRLERESEISEQRAKLLTKLFTSKGGLLLCGGMIGIVATLVLGLDAVQNLLSGLVALAHGIRGG